MTVAELVGKNPKLRELYLNHPLVYAGLTRAALLNTPRETALEELAVDLSRENEILRTELAKLHAEGLPPIVLTRGG